MSQNLLFHGVGIIIDDALEGYVLSTTAAKPTDDGIFPILDILEKAGFPLSLKSSLPGENCESHFRSVGFILLDWDLHSKKFRNAIKRKPPVTQPAGEGEEEEEVNTEEIEVPEAVKRAGVDQTIAFLLKLQQKMFAPVFIFSQQATQDIVEELKKHKLYDIADEAKNWIMVADKRSITDEASLFKKINEWAEKNPSVYCLKMWEKSFYTAKHETFHQLSTASPYWLKILWDANTIDNVDPANEINDLIFRQIKVRTKPFKLEEAKACNIPQGVTLNPIDVLRVIANSQFIPADNLIDVAAGDIFKMGGKYFINIRPDCDTIPRPGKEKIELYLLEGSTLTKAQASKDFDPDYGKFSQPDNGHIQILADGKFVRFNFGSIRILEFAECVREKRLGRLIPPHSTVLQQRYSNYLIRPGLPRISKELIPEPVATVPGPEPAAVLPPVAAIAPAPAPASGPAPTQTEVEDSPG